ncbi:hypothetical protein Pst134EA_032383 [Puccinia striiformis f. sp. tritici]|uniref:uncharacterized protein n=1 Tax=Puccinia striiformis f. sp. tritici TaxID=168172 RepID=UPI002007E750|nr:uncharacterized protein Pst134EA_032383 [Puccinia striiformis f. sp. tritici]KAH9444293.1 hypothetical protein Pst134EA_032383 [Puccinia striiformis f. sp. tritici]
MEKEAGSELERFVKLHAQHDGTTELFYKLEKAAGLEKVFQHIEELDSLFGFNKHTHEEARTHPEADGQKIKTLIRRAHFVRFPECDASELTETKMLHALGFSSALAKQIIDATPQINWSTEITNGKDEHKAPYTSIISPTMSGKTRLLKELAKHVCVVYVCLRKAGSTGQPPRSHLARHFIPEEPKLNMIRHYSHLLIAILKTVHDFFEQPDRRTQELERSFILSGLTTAFKWTILRSLNLISSGCNYGIRKTRKSQSPLGNRRSQQPDRPYRQTTPDSILSRVSSGSIGNTFLNGVLQRLRRYNLSLANFNPALDRDPCSRFHSRGVGLFAPIYKISAFDAFVPKEKPSSWNDLLSAERLFNYGCPFYELYFKGALKKTPEDAVQATAMIAEAKLLFKTQSASPGKLSSPQCFAILGSIIQTRVSLHAPVNSELVASHAAHSANRVLASDDKRWIECIDALADAVKKGLVASGDAGEMATRLILIRAMQKTKPIAHENTDSIPNGHSVQLVDFLRTLSGKDPRDMKFDCIETADRDNLLNNGRIFFNHFTRISYTPSATNFLELLYRGVAVQCKSGQAGLDELFTIYLAPPSTSQHSKLDPSKITFCGVQTKNQTGPVRMNESHHWSKSFAEIEGIKNPYLILLFSLSTTSSKVTWQPPEDPVDTQRVAYQFLGLNEIHCLTTEMRSSLERLINAIADDLLNLHDDRHQSTKDWVKQVTPVFYPRAQTSQTPSGNKVVKQNPIGAQANL